MSNDTRMEVLYRGEDGNLKARILSDGDTATLLVMTEDGEEKAEITPQQDGLVVAGMLVLTAVIEGWMDRRPRKVSVVTAEDVAGGGLSDEALAWGLAGSLAHDFAPGGRTRRDLDLGMRICEEAVPELGAQALHGPAYDRDFWNRPDPKRGGHVWEVRPVTASASISMEGMLRGGGLKRVPELLGGSLAKELGEDWGDRLVLEPRPELWFSAAEDPDGRWRIVFELTTRVARPVGTKNDQPPPRSPLDAVARANAAALDDEITTGIEYSWECPFCTHVFESKVERAEHVLAHHAEELTPEQLKEYGDMVEGAGL